MEIRDRYGRRTNVGRIGKNGTVYDSNGYNTGQSVPVTGEPIRDSHGRIEGGAYVDKNGTVRDSHGRIVPGYTKLE